MFISQEYRNSLEISGYVRRSELRQFDPAEVTNDFRPGVSAEELQNLGPRLQQASRPVVIAGNGIRLSNTIPAFRAFIAKGTVPATLPCRTQTWYWRWGPGFVCR